MLAAFTARTTRVSNPDRSPSFRSSPSDPYWLGAFATGSPPRIITFYRSPWNTPNPFRSLVAQCLLQSDRLSPSISQKIQTTGYERFRPNNCGSHSWRWCYRGCWHQSCPPLILQDFYSLQKAQAVLEHLESPYHTLVHCKGFAPAAPRGARSSVSVTFSGLPLSRPLLIVGLVGHYPTNNLVSRRLII